MSAAAGAAALTLAATPVLAQTSNAHFIASHTRASLSGMDLTVKFKEAGLESGSEITVQLSADLDATYQCLNNGGKNPNDPKKTDIDTTVSANVPFTVPKNGQLSGTITLQAPAASTVLSCPPGQTATLTAVAWSNIELTDLTTGAYLFVPGVFSAGAVVN